MKGKKMNRFLKLGIHCFCAVILIVAIIVGTNILYVFENQIDSKLTPPIKDEEQFSVASAAGQKLSAQILEEGATLLRNEGNVLPLDRKTDKKVNVFGWRSIDWIYGSEGQNASGGVSPEKSINENVDLYKALKSYGIAYNDALRQVYYNFKEPDLQSENLRGVHISTLVPLCEPNIDDKKYYSDKVLEAAKNYSDTAIVVIGRMAGEGMEAQSHQKKRGPTGTTDYDRHYLELSTEEEKLLTYVGANYEKVIVLLNVSNPFELGFLETIPGLDACVYLAFTGTRAMSALPKLLYGETSFSGHTVDTFAYDLYSNPANIWGPRSYSNGGPNYEAYIEGIYVGYRWYETTDSLGYWKDYTRTIPSGELKGYNAVVQYPFGYGLAYNDYSWTVTGVSVTPGSAVNETTTIDFTIKVKNNGLYPGKEVISAYVTAPYTKGGIEKSYVSLLNYVKTETIQPGSEVETVLSVSAGDFRSYDCYDKNNNGFKGYEIEKGEYEIKLMTDSHNIKTVNYSDSEQPAVFKYNVADTIKLDKDLVTGKTVGNLFTGEDAIDSVPIDGDSKDGSFKFGAPYLTRENFLTLDELNAENKKALEGNPVAITRNGGSYTRAMADAWDNATVDEFGNPVSDKAPTWGKNNGLKLTETSGELTDIAKKLGADYDAPEWNDLLDQLSMSDVVNSLINGYYGTKKIDSIGKPALTDLDGPAQFGGFVSRPGNRGTGYPTMVLIASTWNQKLAYEFGKSYGDDMSSVGGSGLWGWAIDSHRSAWFGRNHESPSEDPVLAGTTVANAVKGLSTKGKYCTIKHFALYGKGGNNKWCSEQALREIHLEGFRRAFVDGGALGCMTTYQGIGAEHTETSVALLQGVLRNEWDFKGAITTDYIGNQSWCESIIRCGGNLGMGVKLSSDGFLTYDVNNTTARFQNRLRESAHQTLYMWLHARYYEAEYQKNPDKDDNYVSSTSINSWCWWKPLVTCLNVLFITGGVLWIGLACIDCFVKSDKDTANEQPVQQGGN